MNTNQITSRRGKHIKRIIEEAYTKGLLVKKNQFGKGWCITLPDGSTHSEETDSGMASYTRGY